ncbi:MAG: type II toxin-antitoxin system VapC family toxin [Candidatus Woesearchaeota archaeon]
MSDFADSNIFIYAFTKCRYSDECKKIVQKDLLINTNVLLEIFNGLHKITNDKEYSIRVVKRILSNDNIRIIDFDINLFFETLKRIENINLRMPDAVHYTTALLHGCKIIYSYDKHFDGLSLKRVEVA